MTSVPGLGWPFGRLGEMTGEGEPRVATVPATCTWIGSCDRGEMAFWLGSSSSEEDESSSPRSSSSATPCPSCLYSFFFGPVDADRSLANSSSGGCLKAGGSYARSSSSSTSFQLHFACFFVHPRQAVKFFAQSMCSRLHRSQGGRILSPLCNCSIRDTISALYGPASSKRSAGVGFV